MLVLTRKLMEKLFIGDDICVTVVRLEGGQVRLGIDAPRDVSVVRAELVPERLSASNRGARVPAQRPGTEGADLGPAGTPTPNAPAAEGGLRTPPSLSHGIDNRRRGRSR
jgi:carbon storage regulator